MIPPDSVPVVETFDYRSAAFPRTRRPRPLSTAKQYARARLPSSAGGRNMRYPQHGRWALHPNQGAAG